MQFACANCILLCCLIFCVRHKFFTLFFKFFLCLFFYLACVVVKEHRNNCKKKTDSRYNCYKCQKHFLSVDWLLKEDLRAAWAENAHVKQEAAIRTAINNASSLWENFFAFVFIFYLRKILKNLKWSVNILCVMPVAISDHQAIWIRMKAHYKPQH